MALLTSSETSAVVSAGVHDMATGRWVLGVGLVHATISVKVSKACVYIKDSLLLTWPLLQSKFISQTLPL